MARTGHSLVLEFIRAEASDDPHAFRSGPQTYLLRTAGGGVQTAQLDWDAKLLADLQALQLPGCEAATAQRMGSRIRRFLASTDWQQHERTIVETIGRSEPVLITVRSNAAELYALPWELLTLGGSGRCLGELDCVLLRYAWPETQTLPEAPELRLGPGRILFGWAGAVPARAHAAAIERACRLAGHDFSPERDVVAGLSGQRLLHALSRPGQSPVSVLHLLCHGVRRGETFGLRVEGDDEPGEALLDAAWIRRNLAEQARSVRLIVLCACDSGNSGSLGNHLGSVAQALHQVGFAAVVASRFPLSAAGSIAVAEQLYAELLGNLCSLETSLRRVRRRLAERPSSLDWASLTYYARPADDPAGGEPADLRPLCIRPYRGLFSFHPEHQRFYRGRQAETEQIVKSVMSLHEQGQPQLCIVTGASGSGKSSLVLAGVVPRLTAPPLAWRYFYLRPGRDPEEELASVLPQLDPAIGPAVLCVDQLEELFTHVSEDAVRQRFIQALWKLANRRDGSVCVLMTLRIDFIGHCGSLLLDDSPHGEGLWLDAIAFSERHRIFIAQLSLSELRTTIEEPAHLVGLQLEAGLAARMLQEVGREPGALPLLQDTLDLLWQRRSGRVLTQRAYDELGGVSGALQKRAERLIGALSAAEQRTARRLLEALVHIGQDSAQLTRRRVRREDILPGETDEKQRFERVIGELVAHRLVICESSGPPERQVQEIEVAHEALLSHWPRLSEWLQDDRKMLLAREELLDWVAQRQKHGTLLTGLQLGYAEELERRYAEELPPESRRLIADSREQAERQRRSQRRRSRLLLGSLMTLVLLLGAQVRLALHARDIAEQGRLSAQSATRLSEQQREAARSEAQRAHNTLRVGIARTLAADPTAAAVLLREIEGSDPRMSAAFVPMAVSLLNQRAWVSSEQHGFPAPFIDAVLSDDGAQLGSVTDNRIYVTRLDGNHPPILVASHSDRITCLAFSPDGQRLVFGTRDHQARVVAAAAASPIEEVVLRGHRAPLLQVGFSADGSHVITAAADRSARIWSASRGELLATLDGHPAAVTAAALSPDNRWAATGSGGSVKQWELSHPGAVQLRASGQAEVLQLAFSPDARQLAVSYRDALSTVQLLSTDGSGASVRLSGHTRPVRALSFSPDSTRLITASEDGVARVFTREGCGPPILLSGHRAALLAVRLRSDGQAAVTAAADETVRSWSLAAARAPRVLCGPPAQLLAASFSPDGDRVVAAAQDGSVRIHSLRGSGAPRILHAHRGAVLSATFSPDGSRVLSAGADGRVLSLSADGSAAGQLLWQAPGAVRAAAFSPDGSLVTIGANDGSLHLLRSDGTGEHRQLRRHDAAISSLAFSPDGQLLLTTSADQTAHLWRWPPAAMDEGILLRGHLHEVLGAAFGSDGRYLVTVAGDNIARIWSRQGQLLRTLVSAGPGLQAATLHPHRRWVATASSDGNIRLFGPSELPAILSGHQGVVTAVRFSADGQQLLSASTDGSLWLWALDFEPDSLRKQLWMATPFCLSVDARRLIPSEDAASAQREHAACQRMVSCLSLGAMPYEGCLLEFRRQQQAP